MPRGGLCGSRGSTREWYPTSAIDPGAAYGYVGDVPLQRVTTERLPLVAGWNLIVLPVEPTTTMRAADLGQVLASRGITATQIVRWDEWHGAWSPHLVGRGANNFTLSTRQGYFIRISGNGGQAEVEGYTIGQPVASLGLVDGWNLVAAP
ncbi:MAG: hypothetical protein HYY04_08520 [Chloroflexi bacterium]|nr:hypothetical protein [Chloroflexota bacterium]